MQTSVALFIFNRPETTRKVFAQIAAARPPKLFIIADGPRENLEDEAKCDATRTIIDQVDWPCDVHTDFSNENLGCKQRISSGLNWVFEQVEDAIILEDDCLPHPSFFRFCDELLEKYRHDNRIAHISGANNAFDKRWPDYSYWFSQENQFIWGWATWRRAWQFYDINMRLWPEVRDGNWLYDWFGDSDIAVQYDRVLEAVYRCKMDTWAFQWLFACWIHGGLSILPAENLVSNIGFNQEATHITDEDHYLANIPARAMKFPLRHPPFFNLYTSANRSIKGLYPQFFE